MSPLAAAGALVVVAVWGGARLAAPRGRHGRTGRWRRGRRTPSPTCDDWAELLDAVAAEVRSGSSLTAALAAAQRRSPTHGTFVRPGCHLPFPPTAVIPTDEAVAVQALSAAHTLGGPTAATLHAGAALLRERAAIRAEAQAHSAQARLSARVLTAVPLLFAAWSLTTSGSFRAAVVSPIGVVSVLLGCACNLIGWWWMRRIVRQVAA